MAAKEAARKEGTTYSVGQVDPELEGYSGKTWQSRRGAPGLEGAASGGGGGGFGVSAMDVGGPREATRGMGNTTTQTERGYTVRDMPWNMIDEGADQAFPNQRGDLATGGQLQVATEGMDPSRLLAVGAMLGLSSGPKGTTMGPNGTYGNGEFEMSDIMDWARAHPVLWSIAKGIGNTIVPGLPQIATAGLNWRDRRAARRNPQVASTNQGPIG